MKSLKRLLIVTLAAMPLLLPAGAHAADLGLRRIDTVGVFPLPIPVPVLVPEVRHRQPDIIYVRDDHDRQYRGRNRHADRRPRHEWNRHDRGNHSRHERRQVVIDRDDRGSCNHRPTTIVIADGHRW